MSRFINQYSHNTSYEFSMPLAINGVEVAELDMRCTLSVCGEGDEANVGNIEEIEVEGWKDGNPLDADYVWADAPDWVVLMVENYLNGKGDDAMMEHVHERWSEDAN